MDLNNRELAVLVWVAAFFGFTFLKDKSGGVLASFKQLVRAFFAPKIVVVMLWGLLWVVLCVQGLRYLGMWEIGNLKTTLLWGAAFAFVTLLDINRVSEDKTYFQTTIKESIGVTVLVAFITEAYSFSFIAEIILFPFLCIVAMMQVISEKDSNHAAVHTLTNAVIVIFGLVYLVYGLYMAANDLDAFVTWHNLREFLVPILLSLLFLPYLYMVCILVSYELILVALRWTFKDDSLRRYAIFQAVVRFRFDIDGLRRWKRHTNVFPPSSRESIRQSIQEIQDYQKRERRPPVVSPDLGWCPVAAAKFLADQGLATEDYHRTFDDLWWASSSALNPNKDAFLPDSIVYRIKGDQRAVKRLEVELHVTDKANGAVSDGQFLSVCVSLLRCVVGNVPRMILEDISRGAELDTEVSGRRIQLRRENYPHSKKGGYWCELTIDHSPAYQPPDEG